jgi:hypothetical protein
VTTPASGASMDVAAPTWRSVLQGSMGQDLLMVAEGQRLFYAGEPIRLHWLDRVSLLLARQALSSKQSLTICYPVSTCNLPVLSAVQLLIQDFIQNYPGHLSVLLISPRMEVREQYLNVQVRREPLARVLPIARIRAEGEAATIPVRGSGPLPRPRLYHLARPYLLETPWPKGIGAVIVDHTEGTFDEYSTHIQELAASHKVPCVIHLGTDPFAPFIERLTGAGHAAWVWDHLGLAVDFGEQLTAGQIQSAGLGAGVRNQRATHPFGVSTNQFAHIAAGISHGIVLCSHPVLEAAARRLWDDLSTVQRTFSGRVGFGIERAIQSAYSTYYAMLQMLVPLPVYEEEARSMWGVRPVRRRIADLEAFIPILQSEAPELAAVYWPSLILDLNEMYEALLVANPKYDTLVQQVREHAARRKRLTIVCPNQAVCRMLQLCLRAREGLRLNDLDLSGDNSAALRLVVYKEMGDLTSTDTILFPGQFSFGRRQYALVAAAPEIAYLAYPDEASRIEQQVATIHQTLARMAGSERRQHTWDMLHPARPGSRAAVVLPEPPTSAQRVLHSIRFTRSDGTQVSRHIVAAGQDADLSLWTPFSSTVYDLVRGQDVLGMESEEALRPSEFAEPARQGVLVPAVRIDFVDGFAYSEPDSKMTLFLPASEKTDDRRADGIRPDDLVLFVSGDHRKHLYDAILERVARHPALGTTHILVRYWQVAVREHFLRSRLTYDAFLRRLQAQGSRMQTSPGVRAWVTGDVLGPGDAADIQRVGTIFSDEALTQEWRNIDAALRRVRGLHASLARRLNRVLVQAGLRSRQADAADECIDQELNLYVDDFRDTVSIHRVVAVEQRSSPVPYVFTGRFFQRGTELKW